MVVHPVIEIVVRALIRMGRIIGGTIRIGRRPVRIHGARRSLRRRRLMLRRPVSVRILRYAKGGDGDARSESENLHTELESPAPHFFSALRLPFCRLLHALRLLGIPIALLPPRRKTSTRLKIPHLFVTLPP